MLWDGLKTLLKAEIIQRREEGCDVSGFYEKVEATDKCNTVTLEKLYSQLEALNISDDFSYTEPDELDEICAASQAGAADGGFDGTRGELYDKLYGAWLGRCVGCALGKPLECYPYVSIKDSIPGYEWVRHWLDKAGAYPLDGYVPGISQALQDNLDICCPASQKENISYMESDDDIRYTVLGLLLGENKGNDFTPDDVIEIWQNYLPARMLFTAEACAYANSLNAANIFDAAEKRQYIRYHHNPYREWIGAQIRVDHYAYANAGRPNLAARVAYQDAALSHSKNGVYGAMFCAAMTARAFDAESPDDCVKAGLDVIPVKSRLYEAINKAISFGARASSAEELYKLLWDEFGQYNGVHTINNAACVAASLIYGKGDFSKSITTAVCCGWDTDCNGATVGSILGAMHGANALPKKWTVPLNNKLYSSIPDFHPIEISACAERSLKLYERLHGTVES